MRCISPGCPNETQRGSNFCAFHAAERWPPPPAPPPLRYERERMPPGLIILLLGMMGMVFAGVLEFAPRDDSDTADARSGMSIHRDALTGCEYVSRGLFGGVTPRLDREGKQICRVKE